MLIKKYVNHAIFSPKLEKRDIAKMSAVLKPMKSDYYVVKFWQNRSKFIFWGVKGLTEKISSKAPRGLKR